MFSITSIIRKLRRRPPRPGVDYPVVTRYTAEKQRSINDSLAVGSAGYRLAAGLVADGVTDNRPYLQHLLDDPRGATGRATEPLPTSGADEAEPAP